MDIRFWKSEYCTGRILRDLLKDNYEEVKDICGDSIKALGYLDSRFYLLNKISLDYISSQDSEYVKEIISEWTKVKEYVRDKYSAKYVRLVFVRY